LAAWWWGRRRGRSTPRVVRFGLMRVVRRGERCGERRGRVRPRRGPGARRPRELRGPGARGRRPAPATATGGEPLREADCHPPCADPRWLSRYRQSQFRRTSGHTGAGYRHHRSRCAGGPRPIHRSCCGTPGSTVRFKRRFGRVNPRRLPGPPKPAPDRDYRASLRTLLAAELLRRGEGLAHVAEVTGVPVALVELIRAEQVPEVPEPNTSRDRAGWESAAAASPSTKQSTNDETLH